MASVGRVITSLEVERSRAILPTSCFRERCHDCAIQARSRILRHVLNRHGQAGLRLGQVFLQLNKARQLGLEHQCGLIAFGIIKCGFQV